MAGTYRIGELSARTGHSVHAIRWYEAQGLIPGVTRDGGGRRVYRPEHVQWLRLMDRLRFTGMSIAEMREYAALVRLGHASARQRQELLRAHRERVKQALAEWKAALTAIERKIDYYGEWLASGRRPAEIPRVPARRNFPRPRDGRRARTKQQYA